MGQRREQATIFEKRWLWPMRDGEAVAFPAGAAAPAYMALLQLLDLLLVPLLDFLPSGCGSTIGRRIVWRADLGSPCIRL
jgi:hypothetical protein